MTATSDDTEKREAMTYRLLADKIDNMAGGLQKLEVAFAKLEMSITPRHEIVQEVEKRVPMSVYLADQKASIERITKLEAAPTSTWNRASILVSAGVGCLALVLTAVSILVSVLVATHVI